MGKETLKQARLERQHFTAGNFSELEDYLEHLLRKVDATLNPCEVAPQTRRPYGENNSLGIHWELGHAANSVAGNGLVFKEEIGGHVMRKFDDEEILMMIILVPTAYLAIFIWVNELLDRI